MASYYKYSASMNDRTYFTSVVTNSAGNIKRYFSNVESEIYFGDKEMEDIYQFQFSIDEKVLPVYGYNCYHASELVSGQRLIQGQFILNYTNEQEIKTTLGEIDSSVYESILADSYHPSGGSISDPIYNKLFDIMIGYGYYNVKDKQTYNATCQTIIGCKINGMQKVIDSTGQPIMEVYNFIAMDFIEENIVEAEQAEEFSKDKNNLNNNNNNLSKSLPGWSQIGVRDAEEENKKPSFKYNLKYLRDQNQIVLTITERNGFNFKYTDNGYLYVDDVAISGLLNNYNMSQPFNIMTNETTAFVYLDLMNCKLFEKAIEENIQSLNCTVKCPVEVYNGTKSEPYEISDFSILHLL